MIGHCTRCVKMLGRKEKKSVLFLYGQEGAVRKTHALNQEHNEIRTHAEQHKRVSQHDKTTCR
jgi:hypothetical protein